MFEMTPSPLFWVRSGRGAWERRRPRRHPKPIRLNHSRHLTPQRSSKITPSPFALLHMQRCFYFRLEADEEPGSADVPVGIRSQSNSIIDVISHHNDLRNDSVPFCVTPHAKMLLLSVRSGRGAWERRRPRRHPKAKVNSNSATSP